MNTLQVLSIVCLAISLLNILVASIQYSTEKGLAQRTILFYWLGSTISAIIQGFFPDNDMRLVLVSGTGTFISNYFLGSFWGQLHGVKISLKKLILIFIFTYMLSFLFSLTGYLSFGWYALPCLLGCIAPLPAYLWVVRKSKANLTITQKIFFVTAVLMTLHYLDWSFFKERSDLFIVGLSIAILILFLLSILTPMLASEYYLIKRNNQLEQEVNQKVNQITQIEQRLWESNKLASLGRMAGGVAHELNSPLTAIRISAQAIENNLEPNTANYEKVKNWAQKITIIVDRIAEITSKLRIYANDLQINTNEETSIVDIVDSAAMTLKHNFELSNIDFTIVHKNQDAKLRASKNNLKSVVEHLLKNSIRAYKNIQNPWIKVVTETKENNLFISIIDSGSGVPKNIRSQIFDPFFTTLDLGEGMGLGLSVSQGIINQLGGTISLVSSKPEDDATCFQIKVPL